MTVVKEFTPVLMYVDHERIDLFLNSAKEAEERINNGLTIIEELLERNLEDQEKLELLKTGFPYVHQKMKEQFPFPKAKDEFNLESMGKVEEYAKAKPVVSNICAAFQGYDFTIESGSITLSDQGKESITEENTHYTKNDIQTEAFKLAEKLVKNLNKAKEKGWISPYDLDQVKRGVKIVNMQGHKFIPHYNNILNMNATGISVY